MLKTESGIWSVSSHRQNDRTHLVTVHNDDDIESFTSCSCGDFLSSFLPCGALCYAYNRLDKPILQSAALHPRWRLDRHPLFPKALEALNLDIPQQNPTSIILDVRGKQCGLSIYQQIVCPTKQATRFKKIDEIGKQISALGSSKGDHIFRLTMMKSSRLLNEIKAPVDQGTTRVSVTSSVQPPKRKTRKCGRLPKQPQNQSRLCQVFSTQPKHQVDKAAEKSADRSSGITMIEAASNSGGEEGELKNDVSSNRSIMLCMEC